MNKRCMVEAVGYLYGQETADYIQEKLIMKSKKKETFNAFYAMDMLNKAPDVIKTGEKWGLYLVTTSDLLSHFRNKSDPLIVVESKNKKRVSHVFIAIHAGTEDKGIYLLSVDLVHSKKSYIKVFIKNNEEKIVVIAPKGKVLIESSPIKINQLVSIFNSSEFSKQPINDLSELKLKYNFEMYLVTKNDIIDYFKVTDEPLILLEDDNENDFTRGILVLDVKQDIEDIFLITLGTSKKGNPNLTPLYLGTELVSFPMLAKNGTFPSNKKARRKEIKNNPILRKMLLEKEISSPLNILMFIDLISKGANLDTAIDIIDKRYPPM